MVRQAKVTEEHRVTLAPHDNPIYGIPWLCQQAHTTRTSRSCASVDNKNIESLNNASYKQRQEKILYFKFKK